MSIKHRTKDRLDSGKMRPLFFGWDYQLHDDHTMKFCDLGKNPSWWNRVYNRRPARKMAKTLCRKIIQGADPEGTLFPLAHKPNQHFW